MKVAICTTGGYYYRWAGGSQFYDWLHDYCSLNKEIFEAHIVSWQPESAVPEKVKSDFKNIHYRDNNGCDWGCYDFFVNYLNYSEKKYDYIIFCHDDILSNEPSWPACMLEYAVENKEFDLISFGGQFHELPEPEHVDSSNNSLGYYKSFDSMCFMVKADKVAEINPFVTIPGFDQDECGDSGCTIVMYNILNTWGAESVGIASCEGRKSREEYIDYVLRFKRGAKVRNSTVPSLEKICKSNIPRSMMESHQVIQQGWKFFPGNLAKNYSIGIE